MSKLRTKAQIKDQENTLNIAYLKGTNSILTKTDCKKRKKNSYRLYHMATNNKQHDRN